jgi:hypothetical protein
MAGGTAGWYYTAERRLVAGGQGIKMVSVMNWVMVGDGEGSSAVQEWSLGPIRVRRCFACCIL